MCWLLICRVFVRCKQLFRWDITEKPPKSCNVLVDIEKVQREELQHCLRTHMQSDREGSGVKYVVCRSCVPGGGISSIPVVCRQSMSHPSARVRHGDDIVTCSASREQQEENLVR